MRRAPAAIEPVAQKAPACRARSVGKYEQEHDDERQEIPGLDHGSARRAARRRRSAIHQARWRGHRFHRTRGRPSGSSPRLAWYPSHPAAAARPSRGASGFRYAHTPRRHASAEASARAHGASTAAAPFSPPTPPFSPVSTCLGVSTPPEASTEDLTVGLGDSVDNSPPITVPVSPIRRPLPCDYSVTTRSNLRPCGAMPRGRRIEKTQGLRGGEVGPHGPSCLLLISGSGVRFARGPLRESTTYGTPRFMRPSSCD